MATQKENLSLHSATEIVGTIVGCYGDPALQGGPNLETVFTYIDYTGLTKTSPTRKDLILWSRILLVEFLMPYDTSNSRSRLGLVLRPRSLWLFERGANIADFVGNQIDPTLISGSENTTIVEVNPPYRQGDIIRCSVLPSPVEITDFSNHITNTQTETFDGTTTRSPVITGGVTNFQILGSSYNSAKYQNFFTTQILYYDKNIDARTRIVGNGDTSGQEVYTYLCIGGVTYLYKLKGERVV